MNPFLHGGEKLTVYDNFLLPRKTMMRMVKKLEGVLGPFSRDSTSKSKTSWIKWKLRRWSKLERQQEHRSTCKYWNYAVQDGIAFDAKKVDLEPCPVCNHLCTMAVQSHQEVNTINGQAFQEHISKQQTGNLGATAAQSTGPSQTKSPYNS
jgi:hypothetical protein